MDQNKTDKPFNDEEGSYKEVIQEGDITIEYLKSFFFLFLWK